LAQHQRSGEGAVGVVTMGVRDPEDRHDRVADELLQRAAVLGDDLARDLVVTAEDGANVLRVAPFAKGGRAVTSANSTVTTRRSSGMAGFCHRTLRAHVRSANPHP
jgi:hypothetical protein